MVRGTVCPAWCSTWSQLLYKIDRGTLLKWLHNGLTDISLLHLVKIFVWLWLKYNDVIQVSERIMICEQNDHLIEPLFD